MEERQGRWDGHRVRVVGVVCGWLRPPVHRWRRRTRRRWKSDKDGEIAIASVWLAWSVVHSDRGWTADSPASADSFLAIRVIRV